MRAGWRVFASRLGFVRPLNRVRCQPIGPAARSIRAFCQEPPEPRFPKVSFEISEEDAHQIQSDPFKVLIRLAEDGHPMAQLNVGEALLHGNVTVLFDDFSTEINTEKDPTLAAHYLQLASEQQLAPACTLLGFMYASGTGVLFQDSVRAAELFAEAAGLGDAVAAYNLGVWHMEGAHHLEVDEGKAEPLLRQAVESNVGPANGGDAKARLGYLLVKKDPEAAVGFLSAAEELGVPVASWHLGLMLLHGVGVDSDVNKGLQHMQIAAERGVGEAVEWLKQQTPQGST